MVEGGDPNHRTRGSGIVCPKPESSTEIIIRSTWWFVRHKHTFFICVIVCLQTPCCAQRSWQSHFQVCVCVFVSALYVLQAPVHVNAYINIMYTHIHIYDIIYIYIYILICTSVNPRISILVSDDTEARQAELSGAGTVFSNSVFE
jgi:hypothetical protein